MLKEIVIQFIYAEDCPDCNAMRETLHKAIFDSSAAKNCRVIEIDSENDEAIEISIENDINDLPGCVIGDFSFCGKEGYSYEEFLNAIEETWKNL